MARDSKRRKQVSLTQKIVKDILDYIPETGKFYWKARPLEYFDDNGKRSPEASKKTFDTKYAGKEAFPTTDNNNYHDGKVFDDVYRAHRIAFLWMEGRWPDQVDHINGIRTDNRWENLREVTGQRNMMNKRIYSSNKTGVCGVHSRVRRNGKTSYIASIRVNSVRIDLIETQDFDLACKIRWEAEEKYGFHKNHAKEKNKL